MAAKFSTLGLAAPTSQETIVDGERPSSRARSTTRQLFLLRADAMRLPISFRKAIASGRFEPLLFGMRTPRCSHQKSYRRVADLAVVWKIRTTSRLTWEAECG